MTNDEGIQMTNDEAASRWLRLLGVRHSPLFAFTSGWSAFSPSVIRASSFIRHSSFVIRHFRALPALAVLGAMVASGATNDFPSITLQQAHETALRYHPQISVADLKTLVAQQVTKQVQAAFWPNLSANV